MNDSNIPAFPTRLVGFLRLHDGAVELERRGQAVDTLTRDPLPPSPYQLSALRQLQWRRQLPATFTEAMDLLRELYADGRR